MNPFSSLSKALQPVAAQLHSPREWEILRVAANLHLGNRTQVVDEARDEILRWAAARAGVQLPPEAWKHQEFEHLAGGRDCAAVRIQSHGLDTWAIRTNDPDKNVPRRVWTAEVVLLTHADQAFLSLRLVMGSPERDPRINPAVPGLVRQLASKCGLYQDNEPLASEPWVVESDSEAALLVSRLIDRNRSIPVLILTVPEYASNQTEPLLDAGDLTRSTLGLVRVVVLPARFTWRLTERLGKQLSVYNGAVRLYLPGFAEDANPYAHKLLLVDESRENVADVQTSAQRLVARESLRQFRLGREILSYANVRDRFRELQRQQLERDGAADQTQLSAARAQIGDLRATLERANEESQWYAEQHDTAEERARNFEERLKAGKYRVRQLTDQLKARGHSPDSNIDLPVSWVEFSDWCDRHFADRVRLSSHARRGIAQAEFGQVDVAAKSLLIWLANDYRDQRLTGGGQDMRQPVVSGVRNDRCGADSFLFKWRDKTVNVEWHIKNGGNTRDPSRCMRIYYFWDDSSEQVVVAAMPAHRRTGAT